MSFQNLNVEELKELADFYTVEPEVADADHGPTKKELLAALAAENVSNDDYQTFLKAKESGTNKSVEEKREEARLEAEAAAAKDSIPAPEVDVEPVEDRSDWVLVKMERKNPTFQTGDFVFTKEHPFSQVPQDVARYLIQNVKGFRLALPDEVTDYYN